MNKQDIANVIELCFDISVQIHRSQEKVLKVLRAYRKGEDNYSDTLADEIINKIFEIIRLISVNWPNEGDTEYDLIWDCMFGRIKQNKIKQELIDKLLSSVV
ncbi:hypothetical protein [Paenibacillus sp. VTT E-133291]|uniref:hypothetical protein n=1 Tax=Paenibacillus sp. VTT E-133291 TaxID=1986223 RepID=UPI000BA10E3E|nr:hypothetical protein [Paenibacillus sp. VTT E-133291]OZQ97399.1 hypothetical protein CA598_06285 [Paenibacillus sp. VTT E-133291]